MPDEKPEVIEWHTNHLRLAVKAAGIGLWSWNVDTDAIRLDERAYDIWGHPKGNGITFADLSAHIFPPDRERVKAAFQATRAILGAYEIDFRIELNDEIRWISARGQGDDADISGRTMFGVFLDVTERKQAEESNELLAGEMGHRVKNLLAIASSLAMYTARSSTTTNEMARELTQRLAALGRSHDLVRPVPGQSGKAAKLALLGDLLTVLLMPYDDLGAFRGRIRVSVPRMAVGETGAMTLALVIHELATNSIKYGALSAETGTLDVSCVPADEEVVIVWTERGGPPVVAPQGAGGYGSKLAARSIATLGGSLDYTWDSAGVLITLRMKGARLA